MSPDGNMSSTIANGCVPKDICLTTDSVKPKDTVGGGGGQGVQLQEN